MRKDAQWCHDITHQTVPAMPFPWPFSKPAPPARLAAIFVTAAAGERMQPVSSVEALAGHGLKGDRYAAQTGFWQATDACQVTLIGAEDLKQAKKGQSEAIQRKLDNGHHRRNLVVNGLHTRQLLGKTFRIGTALFVCDKPRPPCGYLDKIEGAGLCRALGRHSGACLRVLATGRLTVGDMLELVETDAA